MNFFGPLLIVLATGGFLLTSSPARSAGDQPSSPPAIGQSTAATAEKARALIEKGRHTEALVLLRPLVERRPVDEDVLFLIGLAAIGASQKPGLSEEARDTLLDAAIPALRRLLVKEPGLVRVRLELARAFFLKGEDTLATRHFEQVLAGEPPAPVVFNVNRFLAQMRARKRWSVRVGVALAPDSNVGASSRERTILVDTSLGRLPFTLNEDNAPKSGVGISVWAGGEYQYPLEDHWRLRAGADMSRREYRSDEFDQMTVSGHVGPRWLIGRASEASLLANVRQHWLSDEAEYRDLGIRVEGRHRLNRRMTASLNASRHERRYDERTHLDGLLTDISTGVGWVATPTVRIDTAAGWGSQRTERERERHTRRWVRLGVTAQLPWGFTVGGSGTLRWTDYPADWFPFVLDGGPRRDLTRSFRLNAYNRAFTVQGFSPQISLVQEQRTSNAQLHDYNRLYGELRFVRLF